MRMRKFFTVLILVPLGLIFIVFAVANRHFVTVSFDPFNSVEPALAVSLPLFALIIAAAIAGVLAGGFGTWFGQRHWRRASRRHEADARDARAELADLKAVAMAARGEPARLAGPSQLGPSQVGFYGTAGRDKQGATL
jgi:uncharacterized integral membrane protein